MTGTKQTTAMSTVIQQHQKFNGGSLKSNYAIEKINTMKKSQNALIARIQLDVFVWYSNNIRSMSETRYRHLRLRWEQKMLQRNSGHKNDELINGL